ncbi:MAG: hypothetical protein IJU23_04855 [Proteobacteria bacterium]|nr:hypothetical protein [Pseudomonadota bacterium]
MKRLIPLLAILFTASSAYADLPRLETISSDAQLVDIDQTPLTFDDQKALQTRLEKAVFQLFVTNVKANMIQGPIVLDGTAVAVSPEAVKDVIKTTDIVEETPDETKKPASRGFFGVGLDRVSSPFPHEVKSATKYRSDRQFYLTTADWLTLAEKCEIDIQGNRIEARVEYRDNAQNVAILSTPNNPFIEPVEVHDGDSPIPGLVYLLLNPNGMFESLTAHTLAVSQAHLYGSSNHTARNGYPIFSKSGALVGLSVGPGTSKTHSAIVHSKILDRALHPEKFDRTTVEEIKLTTY